MTRGEFHTWLSGVTITAPFTLDDARALHSMVKEALPNAFVCVYQTRGAVVRVRVDDTIHDLPIV